MKSICKLCIFLLHSLYILICIFLITDTSSITSRSQVSPYVVLLGDVGTGKSTIVEKLTGKVGRSNSSRLSFTRSSQAFHVLDGSMVICDTPGSNSIEDKIGHNVWIAAALNKFPVSRIMIVVKAETRIDSVVDGVRKYAERLVELSRDNIGVYVAHMDTVIWNAAEYTADLIGELGIDCVVFSGKDMLAMALKGIYTAYACQNAKN